MATGTAMAATDTTTGYERMKGKVKEELRQHFRPVLARPNNWTPNCVTDAEA